MKTIIIAEAGVNHNGSLELAKEMVRKAALAGVDYIKFQTFVAEKVISKFADKANYQKINTGNAVETQLEMVKKLELSFEETRDLKLYCESQGVKFSSSPFDLESLDLLCDLEVDFIKLGSGEITNKPFLEAVASKGLPVIFSTGMSNLEEVKGCYQVLRKHLKPKDISILHCNTEYPTPYTDLNLNCLKTLKKEFPESQIGFSDHSLGIVAPLASVALGASIVEKHFTLDQEMKGPDHKSSLSTDELNELVSSVRIIEKSMGSDVKEATASEIPNIKIARRSIVCFADINKGDVFNISNITTKRPGHGISPMKIDQLLGQIAKRSYSEDEVIDSEELI